MARAEQSGSDIGGPSILITTGVRAGPVYIKKAKAESDRAADVDLGMNVDQTESAAEWTQAWLNAVADGSTTMSQRSLASLESRGGGLQAVKMAAQEKSIHLLLLEDDQGRQVVAASLKPFKVVC